MLKSDKNRDFRPISRFISEMIQDSATVTIEGEYETYLSFRMVAVSMILSKLLSKFQRHEIIQRQITRKWYKIELYLQCRTNRKSHMVYRTAPFSMTLNNP